MGYNSTVNQSPVFHSDDETLNDFFDFFSGAKKGHLTKYIYFGLTVDWYQQLQNYKPYYLVETEKELIKATVNSHFGQKLAAYNIDQLFEIGPGTTTSLKCKTIPLLKAFNPKDYYAIDIYPQYALTAASYIYKSLKINPNVLCHDAFANLSLPFNRTCNAIMMLGGTFGNMLPQVAFSFLAMLSKALKKGDYFILSFDSNKQSTSLRNAYYNIYTKQLALNPLRFLKSYCQLGAFDSEAFTVKYQWNKELSASELLIVPEIKQSLILDNQPLTLDKDLKLVVTFSRKYFLYELVGLVEKFNFRLVDAFRMEDNPIILAVFKKK
jgi:uncharacterized SAM-dependent methyltransferase